MAHPVYKLNITQPCHEPWVAMQPASGGRYCLSCQRTVTDFSSYTDEALQQYFLHYKGAEICGRFKKSQLDRVRISIPLYAVKKRQPVLRKFLLLLLLCFGSTLFQAEVQLGGNRLYAQTAITGKPGKSKPKKKKNSKKKVAAEEKPRQNEIYILGFATISHIPFVNPETLNWKGVCGKPGEAGGSVPAVDPATLLVKTNLPPSSRKPGRRKQKEYKEYFLLPLVGRLRRRGRSSLQPQE